MPEITDRQKQAITKVLNAWVVEGRNPYFHRSIKDGVRKKWPVLYNALNTLAKEFI